MRSLAIVAGAFAGMEGVSCLTHRFVMHGFGFGIHRSHHQVRTGAFELNDLYPLMFSSVAISAFAAGTFLPDLRPLVFAGIGITLYGAGYLFVHEIYIHERIRLTKRPHPVLEWLLLPIVPRRLRERAAASPVDPFRRRVPA